MSSYNVEACDFK